MEDAPGASTATLWAAATPPAEQWQAEWVGVLPELEILARRGKQPVEATIMRASQLDAARLDTELTAMLKDQFMSIFSLFQPRIISALQPELAVLLDFLIFRFSVWSGKPTPGTALMNLRYRNERGLLAKAHQSGRHASSSQQGPGRTGTEGPGLSRQQVLLYGLGLVAVRYVWTRAGVAAAARHYAETEAPPWAGSLWRAMHWVETAFKLGSLANFLAFLRYGKYRSLLERALSIRLVYQKASMARALSFEYLNRQLVWHELSQLLLLTLPLLNAAALKRFVLQRLPPLALRLTGPTGTGQRDRPSEPADDQERQPCSFCGSADVPVPYSALPCKHRYCYYCLRSQCEADPQFCCSRCGLRVEAMRFWRPKLQT